MKNFKLKALGVVLSAVAVAGAGFGALGLKAAVYIDDSRDCDKYAVVYCGTMSVKEIRDKYNNGDHARIYQAMDIALSQIDGDIKSGVVYRNGNVVVDGEVVATNARMVAREMGGNNISGTNAGIMSVSNMGSAQTAFVKFKPNGQFAFAIMKPCGNPVDGHPTFTPNPDVKITKDVDGVEYKVVKEGVAFTYNITVKNTGNMPLTDVKVTDTVQAGVVLKSASAGKITSATTWEHSIDKLGKDGERTFTITGVVPTYHAGKIKNTACVNVNEIPSSGNPDDCDSASVETLPLPAITIVKKVDSVDHKVVQTNAEFTYQITVKNTGNVTLTDATVTDTPPVGVTLLSASAGTIANNTWSYVIPSLAKGAEQTFTLRAKVPAYKAGILKNTACVNTDEINATPDACDDATVEVPAPVTHPKIEVSKKVNNQEHSVVELNKPFDYQVVVTNTGDVTLKNVIVRDAAPAGETLTDAHGMGSIANNVWSYTIAELKVGESKTFTLTAVVKTQISGTTTNTVCVNAPEIVTDYDPTKSDDCDDATIEVITHPNVTITKTVNNQEHVTVSLNEAFTYRVVVKNTGDVDLMNVAVRDAAPTGVTLVSSNGIGTIANNVWTATIAALKVGESKAFTLTATVKNYVSGSLKNIACVNAPEVITDGSSTKDDACDDAMVDVKPPVVVEHPSVSVQKTVNGKESIRVATNTEFTYEIVVRNTGDVALTNVALADKVEAGVTFIGASAGTITPSTWSHVVAKLAVGQSASFTIRASVPTYLAGHIVNTVCVDAPAMPNQPGKTNDGCDTATVEVVPPHKVEVCDASTGTVIVVDEDDKDNYLPKDDPKCQNIKVCDRNSKDIVVIKKSDFDETKYSTDLTKCETPVTPPTTPPTPPVVTELPRTGAEVVVQLAGIVSLAGAATYYLTSRRGN